MRTFIFTLLFLTGIQLMAQPLPPLPAGPPEFKPNPGLVDKESLNLMNACRSSYERILKKKDLKPSEVSAKSREVCFCIAKDVKRREDVNELQFLTKAFKDQLDDDAELDDESSIWLHELDNTEANCRKNTKYRFGDIEPTFSASKTGEQNATTRKSDPKQNTKSKK